MTLLQKTNIFFNNFRNLLRNNKVFFETLTPIIIGGLGLYITFLQLNINKQLMELQTIQMQPAFRIKYNLHQNTVGFYNTESIEIYNDGYNIKNFDYKINVFYEIDYKFQDNINKSYIPIDGFYFAQNKSSNLSGFMAMGICENNNEKIHQLYLDCIRNCINDNYFFIKRIPLIKIKYTDINKIVHHQYFNEYNEISENEYNEFIIQTKNIEHLDVNTASFDIIFNNYINIK